MYLNEIGRVDLLTAEQERDLGRRITEGQKCQARLQVESVEGGELRRLERKVEEGRRAREELIQANLRLVVSIARKYDRHGVPLMDLVQEGNIGLMRASEKYDYSKGFKFSTYATWWIRQAISRAIPDQGRTIRIPAHMAEFINQVNRAERDLQRELDREPTIEEIALRCNMTIDRVAELRHMSSSIVSLDSKLGDEPDSASLGDQLGDQEADDPADTAERSEMHRAVHLVLDELDERDQEIIKMRFGIECEPHTLDEVAKQFNVTRERIRQIEARTLARLRHPHNSKRLRSFVDPA
jgi:RNA polymerase primary sigma factor